MPTERCTFLMMKGIYHRLPEMWISDQPYLLVTYIGQYFPWISRAMFTNLMGPARVAAMIDGGNLFDVKVGSLFSGYICHHIINTMLIF